MRNERKKLVSRACSLFQREIIETLQFIFDSYRTCAQRDIIKSSSNILLKYFVNKWTIYGNSFETKCLRWKKEKSFVKVQDHDILRPKMINSRNADL